MQKNEDSDILFESKQSGVFKKNRKLLTILIENKNRNLFLKKEVLLIGIMILTIFIYLFALNKWNNAIAFVSLFSVLILVSLKLYHTFQERASNYNLLIKKILKSKEKSEKSKSDKSKSSSLKVPKIIDSEVIIKDVDVEQITLSFDLPLSFQSDEMKDDVDIDETINVIDVEVKEHIEIVPVNESNEEGEKRYVLDDFMTYDSVMSDSEAKVGNQQEIEEEIVFEKKIIDEGMLEERSIEEIDPMNSPISDLLKERADERRKRMKDLNYKFNTAKIDDIEKEPAYKRHGVNIDNKEEEEETKKTNTDKSSVDKANNSK